MSPDIENLFDKFLSCTKIGQPKKWTQISRITLILFRDN